MSASLSQQETLHQNDHGYQHGSSASEKVTSPHAPSTRALMQEHDGRPTSAYTHQSPDFIGAGGGALGRQISVQLTPEQFEKLYLQPGRWWDWT